ncbi:MAG: BREX system P-loop protein BrxC [Nannocystis sp.]|nr:BREX system P-loop protein BrxC [Nannocystis sp.]MBA3547589.1 BREX system P-loop protein BrxC [Nannocystis sp.]
MNIGELFETKVEEKIEPVIKVGETGDDTKLAREIGSYVVTPMIEGYLDDFLEHFTDTFLTSQTEIGVWISGYFGSGKSHFAKIAALVAENRVLAGTSAADRFAARIPPDAPRRGSLERSLKRLPQCDTTVLAFNLNTLADNKLRPLPQLLLSEYYKWCGYSTNFIYARVIEAQLDREGKLAALHAAFERRAHKSWSEAQQNPTFYSKAMYEAVVEVAPDSFPDVRAVQQALDHAKQGELYNVGFLVDTILTDLQRRRDRTHRPQRLMLVLDESGQWIESDQGRLSQLQALIEEAAIKGQGQIWIVVTTHGDMGSILKEAQALQSDMKKIEGRFRFKFALTTENIEQVLADRLFRKKVAGRETLRNIYAERGGVLRGLGELADSVQSLPTCTQDSFPVYYPFFPYQIHVIPDLVKALRSRGGRGEQLSGSTRTLLAISQDILRDGRRKYIHEPVGQLVSFDEVYHNLAGEAEISPDVRTDLSRVRDKVPGSTEWTTPVAEVLYLLRELSYVPRTAANLARLLVRSVDEDIPTVLARVEPELERLIKAKLVARNGDEYEFLTGERRTFEDEVGATEEQQYRSRAEREVGLRQRFVGTPAKPEWRSWFKVEEIAFEGHNFPFALWIDGARVGREAPVSIHVFTPLADRNLHEIESQSLREEAKNSVFLVSGRIVRFAEELARFLAMAEVIQRWKDDPRRSEDAKKLAYEHEGDSLAKLKRRIADHLSEGLRTGNLVFRGSARHLAVAANKGSLADALRAEIADYWPSIYPNFSRMPVRIENEERAIKDALAGDPPATKDAADLKLYDKAGKLDPNGPLISALRVHLDAAGRRGQRLHGRELLEFFENPEYGWDGNAIRVGVAAMIRAGLVKVLVGKRALQDPKDPKDPALLEELRLTKRFAAVELELTVVEVPPEVLTETRQFLMKELKQRKLDETPAALSIAAGTLAQTLSQQAETIRLWSDTAGVTLPKAYEDGVVAWKEVLDLQGPSERVLKIYATRPVLSAGHAAIRHLTDFITKHRDLFRAMDQFIKQLTAIEHHIPDGHALRKFLDEHGAAIASGTLTDAEPWKQIVALHGQAHSELPAFLAPWRDEARSLLEGALAGLPEELARRKLEAREAEFSGPVRQLLADLDRERAPSAVIALPEFARRCVRNLELSLKAATPRDDDDEVYDPEDDDSGGGCGGGGGEPRPRTRRLHAAGRVRNVADWEALRDRLDAQVRQILAEGFEVELEG